MLRLTIAPGVTVSLSTPDGMVLIRFDRLNSEGCVPIVIDAPDTVMVGRSDCRSRPGPYIPYPERQGPVPPRPRVHPARPPLNRENP